VLLYLDTSALVKIFVDEVHSAAVRDWVDAAEVILTSRVAYPEALSAFRRRRNEGGINAHEYRKLTMAFQRQWRDIGALDFDELHAGRLVQKHGLRGFDAVHLASAVGLLAVSPAGTVAFSSFDKVLAKAAAKEGFTVIEP
jgi:uncharacterized protein